MACRPAAPSPTPPRTAPQTAPRTAGATLPDAVVNSPQSVEPPSASPAPTSLANAAPTISAPTTAPTTESASSGPAASAAVPVTPPAIEPERLLVLTDVGPMRVDLVVRIDGRTAEAAFEADLDQVLQVADADGDGQVTWQQITENPQLIHGQFGNARISSIEQRKELIYRCDLNRNGRVDRDELPIFLTPQATSSKRLVVQSDVSASPTQRDSPLFAWLDRDQDQRLSVAERRQVAARMRMLDRNDNGAVEATELPAQREVAGERSPTGSDLVWLHAATDWSATLYLLEERYAFGSLLQAADLGLQAAWFEQLDTNADGRWDANEARRLVDLPADLTVEIAFGQAETAEVPELQACRAAQPPVVAGPGQPLPLPDWHGGQLVIRRQDSVDDGGDDLAARLPWAEWDTNDDDQLSADEYMNAEALIQLPMVAVDLDADASVTLPELRDALRRRLFARRNRLQIVWTDGRQALLDEFDTDQNGQVSERELANVAQRWERSADDAAPWSLLDLPRSHEFHVTRGVGDAPSLVAPFAAVDDRAAASTGTPWFHEMDRNQDGELSSREFLGDPTTFQRLDRDGDGFVTPAEATEN